MGIESLCTAVASAVKREVTQDGIKRGKVTGNLVQVAGRSYPYTVAVDIPVEEGDWIYVAIVNNRAVVVGR